MNPNRSRAVLARLRTCVACRQKAAPAELTRWVLADEAEMLPDLAQRAFGRGAWLHPSPKCLNKASAGFSRTFKRPIRVSAGELATRLGSAAERRVASLLLSARRTRNLVIGHTAVRNELELGRCRLVVVAGDARSAASSSQVQRAIESGAAVSWGSKEVLGGLTGRKEAGVLAVLDDGLASALKATIAMAQTANLAGAGSREAQQVQQRLVDHKARLDRKSSTEVG